MDAAHLAAIEKEKRAELKAYRKANPEYANKSLGDIKRIEAAKAAVPDLAAWEADFAKAFHARRAGGPRTHFGYSYAKLGTSVCKDVKCKEKIAKGELRVYKDAPTPFALDDTPARTYYHAECFFTRVMGRAHKWSFEHADEVENYSSLTPEDFARVEALIAEGNAIPQKKEEAKAKAKQDAAQAKFDKAQARANAKLEKAEARAAKKVAPAPEPEVEVEVDYSEVDAWTLEIAKTIADEVRKAKARSKYQERKDKAKAYYEAHKAEKQEYQRKYRETHKEELKVKEKMRNENRKEDLQVYQETYRKAHPGRRRRAA
jgi:hypothetical protein